MSILGLYLSMKYFYCTLVFLLIACSSNKHSSDNTCPTGIACNSSLIANQSFEIKTDGIGKSYPMISEGDQILFEYSYSKQAPENTVDGQYIETIYAIFPKDIDILKLKDDQLQSISLSINHSCFCKELSGLKPIREGRICVKRISENTFQIKLEITQTELNNKIKKINETVTLRLKV